MLGLELLLAETGGHERRDPFNAVAWGGGRGLLAFLGSEILRGGLQAIGVHVGGQADLFTSVKHANARKLVPFT